MSKQNTNARTVPFYRQVADTIKARIIDGQYAVGECIPASSKLEKVFNVSNITMRKSLALLKEEGWVTTQRGKGTVVIRATEDDVIDIKQSGHFTDWLNWASGKTQNVDQTVLSIEDDRGSVHVRRLLNISEDDNLWCMRRLRSKNGEPISYHVSYGRPDSKQLIVKDDFEGTGSFIEMLQRKFPRKIIRIEQHVEAAVADIDIARMLHIEFGDPIFFMEHLYVDENEDVIAVTHLFMRADRYRYSTSIDLE
ncbi:GntR family transcriptional regulator [Emcibacter nanhaiensis]|nr:GntR family transcriptional regulator [Emcibacter nanhaiensis]